MPFHNMPIYVITVTMLYSRCNTLFVKEKSIYTDDIHIHTHTYTYTYNGPKIDPCGTPDVIRFPYA